MKRLSVIPFIVFCLFLSPKISAQNSFAIDYFGNNVSIPFDTTMNVAFDKSLSTETVSEFHRQLSASNYQPTVNAIVQYRIENKLDDWLFYQLIRRTAQWMSPKEKNYERYTLYKWFLLTRSGYDATVKIANDQILFYVRCEENIYNIPSYIKESKQYVCLNFHDYAKIDLENTRFLEIAFEKFGTESFSYKVTNLPALESANTSEKVIQFTFYDRSYDFNVKYNPSIRAIFSNYPTVDYESYFNIPMSDATYGSIIPALKKNLEGLSTSEGVDFLMRFTRYAFLFQPDTKVYGKEKRLSPEQTLISESSDCEDRTALFFFLVKELYDLPMIVLAYPQHVSIAVRFDEPKGTPIIYNGQSYSVCEPTPQKKDLRIGELPKELRKASFEIAYVYNPQKK